MGPYKVNFSFPYVLIYDAYWYEDIAYSSYHIYERE